MRSHEVHVDKLLLRGARFNLGPNENTQHALEYAKLNPHEFHARVNKFDIACEALGQIVKDPGMSRSKYLNVLNLRIAFGKRSDGIPPIPTLTSIVESKDKHSMSVASRVMREMNLLISSGKWQFPQEVKDPNRLLSRLLIQGYGLFLERLYEIPELSSQTFVLAFEEVLWNKFQGSNLLNDILPWMQEERDHLALGVRRGLEELEKRQTDSGIPPVFEKFLRKDLGFQ